MALALSVPLTGLSLLLVLPATRSRLLGWGAPWYRRTLERLWDRHPWSFDASIVAVAFVVCLIVVLPPAATVLLLLRAMHVA